MKTFAHYTCLLLSGGSLFVASTALAQSTNLTPQGQSPAADQAGPAPDAGGVDAQDAQQSGPPPTSTQVSPLDDIVVTATKRANASVRKVPLSVTALGAEQLAQTNLRSVADLAQAVPNANLSSNGTTPGFNNFSIRGLAVYDSIPSSTPTVGVFVDDIFQGVPSGTGLQTFDIASIEVLRGPQGLFFGRNVTAGAILVNTTDPANTFSGTASASVESGLNYIASGVVNVPLGDTLSAKLGAYYNKDRGYFRNVTLNRDVGRSDALILRAALRYEPSATFKTVLKVERNNRDGDGAVIQNSLLPPGRFSVNANEAGYADTTVWQVSDKTEIDVGIGNGTITNIIGYRHVKASNLTDNDTTPRLLFQLSSETRHWQFSNELRYAGTFGVVDVTGGLFYYKDKLTYVENRDLLGGIQRLGGAEAPSETYAEFLNLDVHVTPTLTLNLGQRYSIENKEADIQTLVLSSVSPCTLRSASCSSFSSPDNRQKFKAFIPRLGFQFQPDDDTNVYGFYTKGFRSGGFNVRATTAALVLPYGQEEEDSFEVGAKKRFLNGNLNTTLALFRNKINGLQRAVLSPDPILGVAQRSLNTANARIQGVEADATLNLGGGFTLSGNVGYIDSKFTKILFDLSGNGVIGPEDFALELPFLTHWSYGGKLNYRQDVGSGVLAGFVSYLYRSRQAYDDRNTGFLRPIKEIDGSLSYGIRNDSVVFSLYFKNLLDRQEYAFRTPLVFGTGADVTTIRFSPLSKGRILGGKIEYRF